MSKATVLLITAWTIPLLARTSCRLTAPVDLELDSLLQIPISAGMSIKQTADEAPSSVTIITSEDIQKNEYSSLGEVLKSGRGKG